MKTTEQIIEILKRKVQNLIVEDTISPLFWEDFANEITANTIKVTDEMIEKAGGEYEEQYQSSLGKSFGAVWANEDFIAGARWYREQINK